MRAKLIIFLLLSLAIYNCYAGTGISPKKAKTVAETYYHYSTGLNAAGKISYIDINDKGDTLYYIVNMDKSGFVIVSGTAVTHPIVAISTNGNYKAIPKSGVADYLNNLHSHISKLYTLNMGTEKNIQSEWDNLSSGKPITTNRSSSSVGPLLTTMWNQSPYYNQYCPGGSVTGCVATAMVQIMKFWNYPASGTGSYSYTDAPYGTLSSGFDTAFSWALMPVNLTSSAPQNDINAVASLMYKAGVSVAMSYSPSGSGAYVLQSENPGGPCAQYSYVNYFGYNSSTIQGLVQANYTTTKWDSIINVELNNGRPIEYVGFGTDGGHTWVLDGYNTSGLYDMNWGWGGLDDGFFALNNLDPSGIPLGSDNAMLIGIQPSSTQQTCGEPTSLGVSSITTSGAVISWVGAGSPKSYNLEYQLSGASNWTTVTGITSPTYTLTGLTAGSIYNAEVQQVCSNSQTSSFTSTLAFTTTQATCGVPTSLAAGNISTSGATITWVGVGSPLSYTLNYKASGAGSWTTVSGISSPTYTLTGLAAGTTYNMEVQQVCSNTQTSSFTNTVVFATTQATCGIPTSLAAGSISAAGATITWSGVGSPLSYTLNYKVSGAASWTTVSGISSPTYTLTGLAAGTTYNMEVQQVCTNSQTSSFTNTVVFTTAQATCGVPTSLVVNNITTTGAVVSWVGVGSPKSYNLNYRLSGASTWITISGITSTSYSLTGLAAGNAYVTEVQQVCTNSVTSSFTGANSFTTVPANYCSVKGNTKYDYISNVVLGTINNQATNDGGYGNYTSLSTALTAGQTYKITLTPTYTTSAKNNIYWTVFIDYGGAGTFTEVGRTISTTTANVSFTIPSKALNGFTRLRVVAHNGKTQASYVNNPCNIGTYSDVQDYTVIISGGASGIDPQDINSDSTTTIPAIEDIGGIALNVYPNPTNGVLNLKYLNDVSVKDITVVDATGRILIQSSSKLDALDLSKYSQGWYILLVTGNDGSVFRKLVMVTH